MINHIKRIRVSSYTSMVTSAISFGLTCIALSSSLYAQGFQSGVAPMSPGSPAASHYYVASPGELTMQVNVWGLVKNPGCYEVSSSTNLMQLIGYAGGPVENAKLSEVKILRDYGMAAPLSPKEIIVNLDHPETIRDSGIGLSSGDIVLIDHTGWSMVKDTFPVIATVGIITTAIAQLIIAFSR